MESLRRDRCPQAKAFKPGRSTILQGQKDSESLQGSLGLPLSFYPAAAATVGNAARVETPALKGLTDSSVAQC